MQIVERRDRLFVIDGIVDREIRSRNFGGEERKDKITGRTVNGPGRRNFLLFVSEDIAEELKDRGCEVKYTKVQGPNDVPMPYVSIIVSYYVQDVEAYLNSNGNVTRLDQDHIYTLNNMDFKNVCLELAYGKEKTHQNGVKYIPLYCQKIFAEVVPSYFAEKYAYMNTAPAAAPAAFAGNPDDMPF